MSIQRQLTNERMSQIVSHNGTVYLAGQVGDDFDAGIEQQTRDVLANIERLLDLAGTDKQHLLSATIYLNDIEAHFAGMNSVWDQWLPKVLPRPAPPSRRRWPSRAFWWRSPSSPRCRNCFKDPSPGAVGGSRRQSAPVFFP